MAGLTLQKIAQGGIYDQLGGGFHRYATDSRWQIPHFEKMLYDNALLTSVYLAHYQLTGNDEDRRVAKETLDFVRRELGAPAGGFYAALDSQSDGKEGKYYVWSLDEVKKVVGDRAAPLVTAALGVTRQGNFEGSERPDPALVHSGAGFPVLSDPGPGAPDFDCGLGAVASGPVPADASGPG